VENSIDRITLSKNLPAMNADSDAKPTRPDRLAAGAPRPVPGWLRVGVVVLLLVQGLQMLTTPLPSCCAS
jgi:hypothetical protein